VPIRTVLFTRLCKFDGEKTAILSARDFHQIGGRAGRKGFDERGWVVVQAPEHVVENRRLEEKKARERKKFVKRKPPERNFVNWDKQTFTRLVGAPPERLTSRFHVSHGMLLNVLSRHDDGCEAMREIIRRSHEHPQAKRQHRRRAWQLFRSLLELRVVELIPRTEAGARLRVNVDLQDDFSMDQTLSLYLLDAIPLLDRESPEYPLDLATLVESILEDPEAILRRQLDRIKAEAIAAMKEAGLDYDQRMEELEKLEYPKPLREFIYETFNAFAAKHPWVGQENIQPKSIAREMFEGFRSFQDYVREYGLERCEGLLLRHLSSVYKVLCQTVPDAAKTDEVLELEAYLGTTVRQVDSSLLDEWEKLRDPGFRPREEAAETRPARAADASKDVARQRKAFIAAIRNRIFTFLRALAGGDPESALASLDAPEDPEGTPWTAERLQEAAREYHAEHERICLDPRGRNLRHTHVNESLDEGSWTVQQVLVDPEEACDWVAEFQVDLEASRTGGAPALLLRRIGPLA
jgi:superfamily II RNA helicase